MNTSRKRIVIIGATSSIAEYCARLWAANTPTEFILVGRNRSKTELVASDLRIRAPQTRVENIDADFTDPVKIQILADAINNAGPIDIVLIAHGSLPNQQQCQKKLDQCSEALEINGISPVLFAEAFAGHMEKAGRGTLAIIGSVAGDRGRKSNYVYGAAKSLVARYVQGLQHRLAKTNVKVILIKPGPTDTPMTMHMKNQGIKLASVTLVAKNIVDGINKGVSVIYTPKLWRIIMVILIHIPQSIFKKMNI
jgi:decaprenylphospho-beta-D-erythro-pentofuranosid-2-ulose 2-reductase